MIGAATSRDRWVAFWIVLTILGGLLMLGRYTVALRPRHRIPIAGSSRIPVRFHLWVSLAVAALASVGVDHLERGLPLRPRAAFWLVFALIVASIPILLYAYTPALTDTRRWSAPDSRRALSVVGTRVALLELTNPGDRKPRIRGDSHGGKGTIAIPPRAPPSGFSRSS